MHSLSKVTENAKESVPLRSATLLTEMKAVKQNAKYGSDDLSLKDYISFFQQQIQEMPNQSEVDRQLKMILELKLERIVKLYRDQELKKLKVKQDQGKKRKLKAAPDQPGSQN